MIALSHRPSAGHPDRKAPSLAFAAAGFLSSTVLTATVMVLLSAI